MFTCETNVYIVTVLMCKELYKLWISIHVHIFADKYRAEVK